MLCGECTTLTAGMPGRTGKPESPPWQEGCWSRLIKAITRVLNVFCSGCSLGGFFLHIQSLEQKEKEPVWLCITWEGKWSNHSRQKTEIDYSRSNIRSRHILKLETWLYTTQTAYAQCVFSYFNCGLRGNETRSWESELPWEQDRGISILSDLGMGEEAGMGVVPNLQYMVTSETGSPIAVLMSVYQHAWKTSHVPGKAQLCDTIPMQAPRAGVSFFDVGLHSMGQCYSRFTGGTRTHDCRDPRPCYLLSGR